ncbi:MAG TPA: C39 family peptidase [Ktedonobacteraceae bacterium]|nr:C39 family peptidase [Ktedonobacteraceae bacterium]
MSHLPPYWYKRWRIAVSLGLLGMIALALFVQTGVVDDTLQGLGHNFLLLGSAATGIEMNTAVQTDPAHLTASQRLVRISQLDPAQYSSTEEYNTWAYSACSAASMTEVFDAYGDSLRITDVLEVEYRIGEITPSQGLLRPEGIANTAAQFGFKTNWGNSWSLDAVINTANQGYPVIVSFPPDRYAGGHILVVTGGNSNYVYLADSSLWNRRILSRSQFLAWWEGFAAVVTPK